MSDFNVHKLKIKDAFVIDSFHVGDYRGSFTKVFEKDIFGKAGINFSLNETFYSVSQKNVIRGLHFQLNQPQAKIVTVISGKAWDVIVDLRHNSDTFGKWVYQELSAENHKSIFVPRGFAHGFASLLDNTVMLYQCDGKYNHETDTGIRYDDPDIGINWPIDSANVIHSKRDLELMNFNKFKNMHYF